ncbi:gephyrin-like molybdotransferase Glp [Agrococcus sp. Ld7]|uniref:molybdopterin molybdotransferase MoeA n=1 Tax=Agrococcus sp. Ld7 TaxID=649148 RepID=UPI00386716F7
MSGDLRSVEAQLATVLARVRSVDSERLPVAQAAGRILRGRVLAGVDIPVFDNSAMDGFAVRFDDVAHGLPVPLTVVADVPAGSAADPALRPGEAARIMTGAVLPSAADTVVPFEHTAGGLADSLERISVEQAPSRRGAHVRLRGEDLRAGDPVVDDGAELTALAIAAIAASGVPEVAVARRPRVAVIATGAELVPPGVTLDRGQIPESNSVLLAALATAAGAEVVLVRTVGDDGAEVVAAVAEAERLGADACVCSGGVSAGAYEPVRTGLAASMSFTKVAMQPGKPQGFGASEAGTLLFGLPGNPVSAAVSFEVFVRPALRAMQGARELARPPLRLPAASSWRSAVGRRQYLPAVIDRSDPAAWRVRPATAGGSGSHLAGGLAHAEAYAIVPAEAERVSEGDLLDVMVVV